MMAIDTNQLDFWPPALQRTILLRLTAFGGPLRLLDFRELALSLEPLLNQPEVDRADAVLCCICLFLLTLRIVLPRGFIKATDTLTATLQLYANYPARLNWTVGYRPLSTISFSRVRKSIQSHTGMQLWIKPSRWPTYWALETAAMSTTVWRLMNDGPFQGQFIRPVSFRRSDPTTPPAIDQVILGK
jgi:hypothetical protein